METKFSSEIMKGKDQKLVKVVLYPDCDGRRQVRWC